MKSIRQSLSPAVLTVLLVLDVSLLEAEDTAAGSLRVNDAETLLRHAYADVGPDDIILVITDRPLQKDQVPFGMYELSVEDKVRGIAFSVSRESKELVRGMNAVYHPTWEGQLGTIGNAALTLSKFDEEEISGTLVTSGNNSFGDHSYSYEVSFTVTLVPSEKPEPVAVDVTGADDPPSQAYAGYYRALMAGNAKELVKYLSSNIVKRMPPETMQQIIELSQLTNPTEIEILGGEVSGTEAVVKVEGRRGTEEATATAQMALESGSWKLVKDSWKY